MVFETNAQTNLLDFYNDVYNIQDETKVVDNIYLDFQKVFDKVLHKRLTEKLCHMA